MMIETSQRPWEEMNRIAVDGDVADLQRFLTTLPQNEAARALSRLSDLRQTEVLAMLGPEHAADLVNSLAVVQAADLMEELPASEAAAILLELPSNEQADILQNLQSEEAEEILGKMDPEEASRVRQLVSYPATVAGGLMVTEYLAFKAETTVENVIEDLRHNAETYADYEVQYVYVIDGKRRLIGVLQLRDLLLSDGRTKLKQQMIPAPLALADSADLEEIKQTFDSHSFFGLPVVSPSGELLGLIRRGDINEALAERADSIYLQSQGIIGGDEIRSMPLLQRARRRLSWLSVNILLNVLAASVIAFYQDTLATVIALAAFLPIISDMSGCSGNQAVAVSMRELTLGLVHPREVLRTLWKELGVGLLNGMTLGVLLGALAWLWQGNLYISLVVGGALALNTLIAVSMGGVIPLVLQRLGFDPALASSPILTTVTDLCGFFLTLSFATALLSKMVA